MNKEEATKELNRLSSKLDDTFKEIAELCEEHGLNFRIDGPAYGMGGYYRSKLEYCKYYDKNPETVELLDTWGDPNWGWQASSQSC